MQEPWEEEEKKQDEKEEQKELMKKGVVVLQGLMTMRVCCRMEASEAVRVQEDDSGREGEAVVVAGACQREDGKHSPRAETERRRIQQRQEARIWRAKRQNAEEEEEGCEAGRAAVAAAAGAEARSVTECSRMVPSAAA